MFNSTFQEIFNWGKKWIGFLLFIACSIAIYQQIISNENWNQWLPYMQTQAQQISFVDVFVMILLLIINFTIESIKWWHLIHQNNGIGWTKVFQSVLVGQAFAFFTPNRVGEYAGRILYLDEGSKVKGIAQMAWASYSQLLITLCVGVIALFWNQSLYPWLSWLGPLFATVALIFYFIQIKWPGRLAVFSILQIPSTSKWFLLLLSFLRYLIFTLQYVWGAHMLGIEIPFWSLISSVTFLFLCLTILPTIGMTEIVVRGQLLLLILAPWCNSPIKIISLSSLIWGVNFLVPSILGALFLLSFRLKR